MAEEAEKMAALKKAYADIILNTAKESAARILESERKALRFQQALSAAKEEALATLLRLKNLMDSKIREAETASSGQVRRIQELEVELSEAEDTIGYLREELKRVNNELDKMKNNLVEPLSEQNTNDHATSYCGICQGSKLISDSRLCSLVGAGNISPLDINITTSSQKTSDSHCCLIESAIQAESLKDISAENKCSSNPDIASIIMRSKEPEFYRNGCTQRIRAFEHNLLAAEVSPLGQSDDQLSDFRNEPIVCDNEKPDRPYNADSAKTIKMVTQGTKDTIECEEILQQASSCGNNHVKFFCRLSPRKQRGRSDHIKSTNLAASPDRELKDHEPFKDCGPEDNIIGSVVTLFKKSVSEEPPLRKLNSHLAPVTAVSCKRSEDKRNSLNISFSNGNPGLLRCNKTTAIRQTVTKQSHSDSENEILQSLPHSTEEDIEHGNSVRDPLLFSTTDMKDGIILTGSVQNDAGNTLQMEDSKLTLQDQVVGKNIGKSDTKDDVPATHSGTKDDTTCESIVTPAQAGTDKFLKYTFRRKRKRGSSASKDESDFPEKKSSTCKRSGEKQNALMEPQKPSIVTELPRNNRRLVQVARQLISLSEKRW